jgi:molecular chaperone DnaK
LTQFAHGAALRGKSVGYFIGVDLGTTYTAAAVARGDRVEVAALGNHSTAVSSVLWVGENGDVLVGDAAQRRALTDPARVAREFKRRLGDTTPLLLGGTPYSVESLSAKLLSWVVAEVTRTEGTPPDGVAVTHPANWGAYKKDLLAQAVRLADLPAATTLTEPQAAATFYASQQRVEAGDVIAVFDLGGGTFDAAVIRKIDDGRFDILGQPEGIERLGGIDFDDAVFAHVASMAQAGFDALDPDDSTAVAAVARLREECVEAKEALSSDTDVSIPVLLPSMSTEVRLTRSEFEGMIRPRIEDAIGAMRRSLATAQVEPKDVRAILLVGGSSRIPLVAQMVSAAFGRPVAVDAHPKNAIAMGAAIAARTASGETALAAAVAEPELPVQPEREDTGVLPVAAAAAAGAALAATTAALPAAAAPSVASARASAPPPPPPVHKAHRSVMATVLPVILGLALLGGGSYYMFGRHHHKAAATTPKVSAPPGQVHPSTGPVTHPNVSPTPHLMTATNPILTPPPAGTGPFDTAGSTDCQQVAAAANGLPPTNPGSAFTAQCQSATWDLNGAPEHVVALFSSSTDTTANPPMVEVLTQSATDQTWTPVLLGTATSSTWQLATIDVANLTTVSETDPQFVIDFHNTDASQQVEIIQSNNGVPTLLAQTAKAYHPSLQVQPTEIAMYGTKTVDSPLRVDTIKWVADKNSYYGLFTFVTSPEPTSTN